MNGTVIAIHCDYQYVGEIKLDENYFLIGDILYVSGTKKICVTLKKRTSHPELRYYELNDTTKQYKAVECKNLVGYYMYNVALRNILNKGKYAIGLRKNRVVLHDLEGKKADRKFQLPFQCNLYTTHEYDGNELMTVIVQGLKYAEAALVNLANGLVVSLGVLPGEIRIVHKIDCKFQSNNINILCTSEMNMEEQIFIQVDKVSIPLKFNSYNYHL